MDIDFKNLNVSDHVKKYLKDWYEYQDNSTWVTGSGKNNPFYGKRHTDETRKRLSNNHKDIFIGEKNPNYGKHHSEETRRKMSSKKIGRFTGEKNHFYGKHHTEETRIKLSDSQKARYAREKHPWYGRSHTEESRKRMSNSLKGLMAGEKHPNYGKHHSEETKRKIGNQIKGLFAGEKNPMYGRHHSPATKELIRKKALSRPKGPKSAKEFAKPCADISGENNPFFGKHHTDESKHKAIETKIRNGTLRFPEKSFVFLRIAKELYDAGVPRGRIVSLAVKQMEENGMKINEAHARRVAPPEYKRAPRSATPQCFECGSETTRKDRKGRSMWYRPGGQYQCTGCYMERYGPIYNRRPDVRVRNVNYRKQHNRRPDVKVRRNEQKKQWRAKRKALALPYH